MNKVYLNVLIIYQVKLTVKSCLAKYGYGTLMICFTTSVMIKDWYSEAVQTIDKYVASEFPRFVYPDLKNRVD